MEEEEDLTNPDYTNPEFILQNLTFINDCYDDSSNSIRARSLTFEIISHQINFYLMCSLRTLIGREIAPSIFVIGTGKLGSKVIDSLVEYGCGPLLKVYSRSDVGVKKWKARGLTSNNTIPGLSAGHNPDIIILCCNIASFPQLCRDLSAFISPNVFIISASFGLSLKRIHHLLKTASVFRTHTEPAEIRKMIQEAEKIRSVEDSSSKNNLTNTTNETLDSLLATIAEGNKSNPDYTGRTFDSGVEYSAFLLAGGNSLRVKNFVLILENYYSIIGMPHVMARQEALLSVLGQDPIAQLPPSPSLSLSLSHSTSMGPLQLSGKSDSSPNLYKNNTKINPFAVNPKFRHTIVMDTIHKNLRKFIGNIFQTELSKHIRVVDLPRIVSTDIESKGRVIPIYTIKERAKGIKYLDFIQDIANRLTPILDEESLTQILNEDITPVNSIYEKAKQKKVSELYLPNREYELKYSDEKLSTNFNGITEIVTQNDGSRTALEEDNKMFYINSTSAGQGLLDELESWVSESEANFESLVIAAPSLNDISGDITSDIRPGKQDRVRVHFPEAVTLCESEDDYEGDIRAMPTDNEEEEEAIRQLFLESIQVNSRISTSPFKIDLESR